MDDATILDSEPETVDVRRRPRFEGRIPCRLVVDGHAWHGWLRDLAVGGAGIEPAMPALLNRRGTLISPYLDFEPPLSGRVVNVAHRRTCIAFDLDPPGEEALERFLDANT